VGWVGDFCDTCQQHGYPSLETRSPALREYSAHIVRVHAREAIPCPRFGGCGSAFLRSTRPRARRVGVSSKLRIPCYGVLAWDKAVRGEHGGAREGAGRKPASAEVPAHDPETREIKTDNVSLEYGAKRVRPADYGNSAQSGLRRLEKAASSGEGNAAGFLRRVVATCAHSDQRPQPQMLTRDFGLAWGSPVRARVLRRKAFGRPFMTLTAYAPKSIYFHALGRAISSRSS